MRTESIRSRLSMWTVRDALAAGLLLAFAAGCGSPQAEFRGNLVYVKRKEIEGQTSFTRPQSADMANILAAYFGTPDDPHLPKVPEIGRAHV